MDIDRHIGHPSQLYGATPFTYADGKAKGVRAIEVRNGSGLEFKILEDRGLDISSLSWKGTNVSYLSKCGIVAPEYFRGLGFDFLDSFFVGFLTTCGLRHIGAPCTVDGEDFGLHGTISNIPAEEVQAFVDRDGDEPVIRVKGKVRDGRIFKQNLLLEREYVIPVMGKGFTIRNRVRNIGFHREAVMLMLHINFGYPLLSGDSKLILDSLTVEPRDEDARKGFETYLNMEEPHERYPEQVFFHTLEGDGQGMASVALANPSLGFGVALHYSLKDFPYLTQWKQFENCDYVLGLEPASCKMIGRKAHSENGTLDYLEPGDYKDFNIQVEFFPYITQEGE